MSSAQKSTERLSIEDYISELEMDEETSIARMMKEDELPIVPFEKLSPVNAEVSDDNSRTKRPRSFQKKSSKSIPFIVLAAVSCYYGMNTLDKYDSSSFPATSHRRMEGSVQGSPLIMGLQGQVYKFEGRPGSWYNNIAIREKDDSNLITWNIGLEEFDTCPLGSDTFVTGSAITVSGKGRPETRIVLSLGNTDTGILKCQGVCLGNGSLKMMIGSKYVTRPGDYSMPEEGIRIVAHNTYAACSRKPNTMLDEDNGKEEDQSEDLKSSRRLQQPNVIDTRSPISFILQDKKSVINPKECEKWILQRQIYGDLFAQEGLWSTVHIETPYLTFHIELRQSDGLEEEEEEEEEAESCRYSSLDSWVSDVHPSLARETWRGILGETFTLKKDEKGNPIMSDRSQVLSYEDDSAYEVEEPFSTSFTALESDEG